MAGILTEQDQTSLHHLATLLPPNEPIAKDVSFGEVSEYVGAALNAQATPEGSKARRRTGRIRKALEGASNVQTLIWGIPAAVAIGFITYIAGNEGLQALTAWQNYFHAQDELSKIHYSLNPLQFVDDFKLLQQQLNLTVYEAQQHISAITHSLKSGGAVLVDGAAGLVAAKLRPRRRLAVA